MASQKSTFEEVEKYLGAALGLIPYYAANHQQANPVVKTQLAAFHLKNRDATHQLKVSWYIQETA